MSRSLLVGAAALVLTASVPLIPAAAQGDADRADSGSIMVYSPVRESNKRRSSGSMERTLTASSAVYHDDLNLRTQWGRAQLEDRIKLAAKETCEYLGDLYPLDTNRSEEYTCVKRAVQNARPQMQQAVFESY